MGRQSVAEAAVILRHLTIERFRNLARVDLDLSEGVTLFWGKNAQGKTNLLEAVHYLATGRSFRTRLDRECLPWSCEPGAVARVEGRSDRANGSHRLAIALTDRAKFAWVDGKPVARLGDLLGNLMIVLFTPDDIGIAAGSPVLRRRYLDIALSQVSSAYLGHLQGYAEALRQRNAALRSGDSSMAWPARSDQGSQQQDVPAPLPDPWAGPLIEHGVEVSLMRRQAVAELSALAAALYAEIAPGDGRLSVDYRNGSGLGADDDGEGAREHFRRRLHEVADAERVRRQTLAGSHRDDLILLLGGREVRHYGSQGQQRSVALALRLAEMQWMAGRTSETPVLLVDDLGAELDRDRQMRLLALFSAGAQTLATTAGDPAVLGRMIGANRAMQVHGGELGEDVENLSKSRENR